jgi:hypothetical protein
LPEESTATPNGKLNEAAVPAALVDPTDPDPARVVTIGPEVLVAVGLFVGVFDGEIGDHVYV